MPSQKAYALPSDCLAPRDIQGAGTRDSWTIQGKILLFEYTLQPLDELTLLYTRRVTDTTHFTDPFIDLLAVYIAQRISPSVAQDKNLTNQLLEMFERTKFDTWEADSNIGNQYREPDEQPRKDTFVEPDVIPTEQYIYGR